MEVVIVLGSAALLAAAAALIIRSLMRMTSDLTSGRELGSEPLDRVLADRRRILIAAAEQQKRLMDDLGPQEEPNGRSKPQRLTCRR